mmetsp:Transcript_106368/g.295957  ORF Transcript_106368/g.295957 Transcript_106368/m.295957 type:complete len:126 (+) Transcript_106368:83-460(+)
MPLMTRMSRSIHPDAWEPPCHENLWSVEDCNVTWKVHAKLTTLQVAQTKDAGCTYSDCRKRFYHGWDDDMSQLFKSIMAECDDEEKECKEWEATATPTFDQLLPLDSHSWVPRRYIPLDDGKDAN